MADSRVPNAENSSETQSQIVSLKFTWTIKNFSYHIRDVGYSLQSSSFSSGAEDKIMWYVKAFPKGMDSESEGYLSIFLFPEFEQKHSVLVKFRCFILDASSKKSGYGPDKDVQSFKTSMTEWGWHKFVEIDVLQQKSDELLPNDTLNLYCEVSFMIASSNTEEECRISNIFDCGLGDDFSELLSKESFCDVTLVANGEEFKVHKNILTARSPVFAAMFTTDMKEKNQDEIQLIDMNNIVLRDLLYFIYSGKAVVAANVKQTAGLLAAADKYDFEILKKICEEDLCQQISVDNAPDLLLLAYLHNAVQLKEKIMDFIYNPHRLSEITKSENWSCVVKHPRLLNEVLIHRAQRDVMNMTS